LHNSLEKAKQQSSVIYTRCTLRAIRKQVIESIDHILNNDLVLENHSIARYVDVIEKQIQSIKEDFTKDILSVLGNTIGNDGELTYASFNNKQRKVETRLKGYGG